MKTIWIRAALVLVLIFSLLLTSCNWIGGLVGGDNKGDEYEDYKPDKEPGGGQFDFPGNYSAPELKIDGKADDPQWADAKTIATFGHGNAATIKIYRGNSALFFFAEVADAILATEGETNDDAVTRSDSVEIYIDTLADGGTKPKNDDYQINLGIHGKTRIMQGSGSGWGGWNGLIDYEVQLKGTLNDGFDANDTGYTVEVMIPYSQIGIEKDDAIAVSFGQVDKVGPGASATVDWDWYGWTYNSVIVEPQTPNNYLLLDKDNNVMSRDEEAKPAADMAGYVLDYATDAPIAGATVSISSPDGLNIAPITTDEQGYFVFEKVDSGRSYTITVEKEGFFSNTVEYTRAELRASNGGRVLKNVILRDETTVAKTTIVGTVKNIVEGVVGGATVLVEGTTLSTVAGDDGSFSIEGVPAEEDITLVISKAGYGTSRTDISAELLVQNGQSALGDVNLNLAYAQTGNFGLKSEFFADSTMQLSRTLTGVEMLLFGTRKLDGSVEIYLDVKDCAAVRDEDATMWRFDLRGDGTIGADNYAAEGDGSIAGLVYTLYKNEADGYSARLFIPYEYMGISPLEVFGISLGQWSTTANDWDGWGFNGQFIPPEKPVEFVRVSATNELYRGENNISMVNLWGNTGLSGVKVEINGTSTVTGADGAWNMRIAATDAEMSIVYSRQGYITKTTIIPAGYFGTHHSYSENVELELHKASISGIVTETNSGEALEGVAVTVVGTEITAITGADGKYTIEGIEATADITLKFTKNGYDMAEKSITAAELETANAHTVDAKLASQDKTHYITLSGKVVDKNGAVAGAVVTVVGRSDLTATTGADGSFSIEKFPVTDCEISISAEDYLESKVAFKAASVDASASVYSIGDITVIHSDTALVGVVKNVAMGTVGGATVRIEGTELSAVTDGSGKFVIENVPSKSAITLVVSGNGFADSRTSVALEALVAGGNTDLGDVNLSLPYANTGAFGGKNNGFANSTMELTRTLTGIEVRLSGTRKLSGSIEFYFDIKECAPNRDQDATAWRFDLQGDGNIGGTHFAGGALVKDGLVYNLISNTDDGYSATFFIPYSYLGIEPTEVFGISLGQWSTSAMDWDGWDYGGFVAPETPATYMRVSATNEFYRNGNNDSMIILSGNTGIKGVNVSVGGANAVSGEGGDWSIRIPATSEALTIGYSLKGYVTQSYTIPAATLGDVWTYTVPAVVMEKEEVSISGIVTDSGSFAPIAGATVTVVGTELTATTDADGKYTISGIGTSDDITVKFEAADYAAIERECTVAWLSSSDSHILNVSLVSTNQIKYTTLQGIATNVNGPVAGATVSVVGSSELTVTTDAQGVFSIANFPIVDSVIRIEKAGYIVAELSVKASDISSGAQVHNVGAIDLPLEYEKLYGLIADKSDAFAAFQGYVTRSATGFEFRFEGSRAFTGRIELFVDTKTSAGDNARDTSDYLFNLNADGTITIVNWGEGTKNEAVPADMKLTVVNADTTPVVTFTLPYSFFGQVSAEAGITATEVIGISAGQWMGSDWDGWDNFALWGANNSAFVKPEMPTDYIRIGAYNEIYNHISNDTLNLNDYQINFGTGYNSENNPVGARPVVEADNFYAKIVSRDENGVTFSFITTGDFGTRGGEKEMVLIYFDKGESTGGWTPDYLIKVASDGTVYGRASNALWSATDADKIGTVTITRENGVTSFELTVSYELIGVAADEVFGVAMRECSHNAGDHSLYDPWWDCYFNRGTDIGAPTTGIDAANCAAYIRVAADGTLYLAASNN